MIIKRLINYSSNKRKVLNWELCESFFSDYNKLLKANVDTFLLDITDFTYYDVDALTWLSLLAFYWKQKRNNLIYIRLPENKVQLEFLLSFGFMNFIDNLNRFTSYNNLPGTYIPTLFNIFETDYNVIKFNFYSSLESFRKRNIGKKTINIFRINFLSNQNTDTSKDKYKFITKDILIGEFFSKYFIDEDRYKLILEILFGKKLAPYNLFLESMDEIWDNVIKHSGNKEGLGEGFISFQIMPSDNTFRCTVMDCGKGLKNRLSEISEDDKPKNDYEAIKKALLFRSKSTDELRGLYKTVKILSKMGGEYYIRSGEIKAFSDFNNKDIYENEEPEKLINDNFKFQKTASMSGTQIRMKFVPVEKFSKEDLIKFYQQIK